MTECHLIMLFYYYYFLVDILFVQRHSDLRLLIGSCPTRSRIEIAILRIKILRLPVDCINQLITTTSAPRRDSDATTKASHVSEICKVIRCAAAPNFLTYPSLLCEASYNLSLISVMFKT